MVVENIRPVSLYALSISSLLAYVIEKMIEDTGSPLGGRPAKTFAVCELR